MSHAEAITYAQRAYDNLVQFAAQIVDTQIKRVFLTSRLNAHIVSAWESGRILPWKKALHK